MATSSPSGNVAKAAKLFEEYVAGGMSYKRARGKIALKGGVFSNNAVLFNAEKFAKAHRAQLRMQQRNQVRQELRDEERRQSQIAAGGRFRGTKPPITEQGKGVGKDPADLEWWLFSYRDPMSKTGESVDVFVMPRPGDSHAGTVSRIARALAEDPNFNASGVSISDMYQSVLQQLEDGEATLNKIA